LKINLIEIWGIQETELLEDFEENDRGLAIITKAAEQEVFIKIE
jgi:hypothetical protein